MVNVNVYIHYKENEQEQFELAAKSAQRFSSKPLNIFKLNPAILQKAGTLIRQTEKSTRYFLPNFHKYRGYSVFLDSHVILRADIMEMVYALKDRAIGISSKYGDDPFIVWDNGHKDNKKLFPNSINMDHFFTLPKYWWTKNIHYFDDSWVMDSLIYYRNMEVPQEYNEELSIKVKNVNFIEVNEKTEPEVKPLCVPCSKKKSV